MGNPIFATISPITPIRPSNHPLSNYPKGLISVYIDNTPLTL